MNKSIGLIDLFMTKSCRLHRTLLAAAILATTAPSALRAEQDVDNYSINALLDPSPELLLAESRGRVTIYDGLYDHVVEQALDDQFHRIQSMMFVNTRYQEPDEWITQEDDCD